MYCGQKSFEKTLSSPTPRRLYILKSINRIKNIFHEDLKLIALL
jgi:hypothetical protein